MAYKRLARLLAYTCASLLVLVVLGAAGLYASLKRGIVPVARVEDYPSALTSRLATAVVFKVIRRQYSPSPMPSLNRRSRER